MGSTTAATTVAASPVTVAAVLMGMDASYSRRIKPGRVRGNHDTRQAPHVNVTVLARGLLRHLYTRLYFEDEIAANAEDEILRLVPDDRRPTLVARQDGDAYVFNIKLQGEGETIFFDV